MKCSWVGSNFSHQAGRNSWSVHLAYCSTLARDSLPRDVVTGRSMGRQQRLLLAGTCPQGTWESLCTTSSAETVAVPSPRGGTCLGGSVLSSSPTKPHQLCGRAVPYGVSQTDFITHTSLMHFQLNTGISSFLQRPGSNPNHCLVGCRSLTLQG